MDISGQARSGHKRRGRERERERERERDIYIYIYMGGCQNYGPFVDPYYNTAPNIQGTQKGTIILTTTHIYTYTEFWDIEGFQGWELLVKGTENARWHA